MLSKVIKRPIQNFYLYVVLDIFIIENTPFFPYHQYPDPVQFYFHAQQ